MLLKDNLRLSFNDRPAKAEPLPIPKIPNITYNYFMKKGRMMHAGA
jgi:hypothetical protein